MKLKDLIREYKWTITPISYVLLLGIFSIFFLFKNSNHELIDSRIDSVDGILLGSEIVNSGNFPLNDIEKDALKSVSKKDLIFYSKDTILENIENIKTIYGGSEDNKVALIGYMTRGIKDCKRLKYFSLGQNGKHYAVDKGSATNAKLIWNSKTNIYIYYNFFESKGLNLEKKCLYIIMAR